MNQTIPWKPASPILDSSGSLYNQSNTEAIGGINFKMAKMAIQHLMEQKPLSEKDLEWLSRYCGFSFVNNSSDTYLKDNKYADLMRGLLAAYFNRDQASYYAQCMINQGINSLYTPESLSLAIGDVIKRAMGDEIKQVLIPGVGKGSFCQPFYGWPCIQRISTCDIDPVALSISQARFPGLDSRLASFTDLYRAMSGQYDVVCTHVPAGLVNQKGKDTLRNAAVNAWENDLGAAFIDRGLSCLRPGGVGAFIMPYRLIDGPLYEPFRAHIMKSAGLVSVLPLDYNQFRPTSLKIEQSYLLVLQKRILDRSLALTPQETDFVRTKALSVSDLNELDLGNRMPSSALYLNQYLYNSFDHGKLFAGQQFPLTLKRQDASGGIMIGYHNSAPDAPDRYYAALTKLLERDFNIHYISSNRVLQKEAGYLQESQKVQQPKVSPSNLNTSFAPAWADAINQGVLSALSNRFQMPIDRMNVLLPGAADGVFGRFFYDEMIKAGVNPYEHIHAYEWSFEAAKTLRQRYHRMDVHAYSFLSNTRDYKLNEYTLVATDLPTKPTRELDPVIERMALRIVRPTKRWDGTLYYSRWSQFIIKSHAMTRVGGINAFIIKSHLLEGDNQELRGFIAHNYHVLGLIPLPGLYNDKQDVRANRYLLLLQKTPYKRVLTNDENAFIVGINGRKPDSSQRIYSPNAYVNDRITAFFARFPNAPIQPVFNTRGRFITYQLMPMPDQSDIYASQLRDYVQSYLQQRLLSRTAIEEFRFPSIQAPYRSAAQPQDAAYAVSSPSPQAAESNEIETVPRNYGIEQIEGSSRVRPKFEPSGKAESKKPQREPEVGVVYSSETAVRVEPEVVPPEVVAPKNVHMKLVVLAGDDRLSLNEKLNYRGLTPFGDTIGETAKPETSRRKNSLPELALEQYKPRMIILHEGKLMRLSKINQDTGNVQLLPWTSDLPKALLAMESYVRLRDAYFLLTSMERDVHREQTRLRGLLKACYDRVVFHFASLHNPEWEAAVSKDPFFEEIQSLESMEEQKPKLASIFFEPEEGVIQAEGDSVNIVQRFYDWVDRQSVVDIPAFAKEVNIGFDRLVAGELKGVVFYDPSRDRWLLGDEFLQGNAYLSVRRLEDYLQTHPGLEFVKRESITQGIAALKEAYPKLIRFNEIQVLLGATWIPTSLYDKFLSEKLGAQVITLYDQYNHQFYFDIADLSRLNLLFPAEVGVKPYQVLQLAFKNEIPDLKNRELSSAEKRRLAHYYGTQIDRLRDEFSEWTRSLDDEWKARLEQCYNEHMNGFIIPNLSNNFRKLSDMKLASLGLVSLYPSQKEAVHQILLQEGGLVDHEVGTGKTITECAIAHELLRQNRAKRVLIVVTKATFAQVVETYKSLYPEDTVFSRAPGTREKGESRLSADAVWKGFLTQIATSKSQGVIFVTREQLKSLKHDPKYLKLRNSREVERITQTLHYLRSQKAKRLAGASLVSKLDQQIEAVTKVLNRASTYQTFLYNAKEGPYFQDLSIDHIIVDEAHGFRNLHNDTKHGKINGVSNGASPMQSLALLEAVRYIQQLHKGDRGVTFVSGTVLTNSLTELYSYMYYLCPERLHEMNCPSLDAWLSNFASFQTDYEINWANEVLLKQRLRNFNNAPELQRAYLSMTNYQSAERIGLDRPRLRVNFEIVDQTSYQKQAMFQLQELLLKGMEPECTIFDKEQIRNMLTVVGLERKISSDVRLVNPGMFADERNTKIECMVGHVLDIYLQSNDYKGTQFIFCDFGVEGSSAFQKWNVYDEIKKALITAGIPEEEIAVAQAFTSPARKTKLIKLVNDGEKRVVIGSSSVWGEGINAQRRCVAEHMFDTPWTYAQIEQRIGRMQRQGNMAAKEYLDNEVQVFYYATKRSIDSYKFYILGQKQAFTDGFKATKSHGRIIAESLISEEGDMSQNTFAMLTSGHSELIEKERLEATINRLSYAKGALENHRKELSGKIAELEQRQESLSEAIRQAEQDLDTFRKGGELLKSMDRGAVYEGAQIGLYLSQLQADEKLRPKVKVAEFNGLPLCMDPHAKQFKITLGEKVRYQTKRAYPADHALVGKWLSRFDEDITQRIAELKGELEDVSEQLPETKKALLGLVWKQEQELVQAQADLDKLKAELKDKPILSDFIMPDIRKACVEARNGVYGLSAVVDGKPNWVPMTALDYAEYESDKVGVKEITNRLYRDYDPAALLPSSDGVEIAGYYRQFVGGQIDLDIGATHIHGVCLDTQPCGNKAVLEYYDTETRKRKSATVFAGYHFETKAERVDAKVGVRFSIKELIQQIKGLKR